jgi:hypothetical protein
VSILARRGSDIWGGKGKKKKKLPTKKCKGQPEEDSSFGGIWPCRLVVLDVTKQGSSSPGQTSQKIGFFSNASVSSSKLATTRITKSHVSYGAENGLPQEYDNAFRHNSFSRSNRTFLKTKQPLVASTTRFQNKMAGQSVHVHLSLNTERK